jgi:hypothetical protein
MVEMALVLPFVLLVLGAAYTGWDAMHRTIGLTSAARAGTISAANDLQNGKSCTTALTDATNAVNAEEGVTGVYTAVTVGSGLAPCTTTTTCTAVTTPAVAPAMTGSCVTLGTTTGTLSTGQGLTVGLVTITVSRSVATDLPIVPGIKVAANGTARYK